MKEMKSTMKSREGKRVSSPADFQGCLPSRHHLTLTPNPICSPARTAELAKRYKNQHHLLTRCNNRGGQASPSLWAKNKPSDVTEPTSPKVTCAGQIKIRPKKRSSKKNWQSVMEEIEKLHTNRIPKTPIRVEVEPVGFKKDLKQFLRGIQLDLCYCFGSVKDSDASSNDEETAESRAVFSKWYMVLQENINKKNEIVKEEVNEKAREVGSGSYDHDGSVVPPSNALLLMRCRSTHAKSLVEDKGDEEVAENASLVLEQEVNTESLILECIAPDLLKVNSDFANEKWNVGGMKDPLSRSQRWRTC